jgi:XapX domain-containing protein
MDFIMKPYVLSLAAGLLVGVIYGLMNVRSPAPPVIALVGLFGILLGEQVVPLAKRLIERQWISVSMIQEDCSAHVFGRLPGRSGGSTADSSVEPSTSRDS